MIYVDKMTFIAASRHAGKTELGTAPCSDRDTSSARPTKTHPASVMSRIAFWRPLLFDPRTERGTIHPPYCAFWTSCVGFGLMSARQYSSQLRCSVMFKL